MPKSKKRIFREGDKVVCCTDRFVLDWGYEQTYEDCLKQLAKEAGVYPQPNQLPFCSDRVLEYSIFRNHPRFKDCQDSFNKFSEDLGKALWSADDRISIGTLEVLKESPASAAATKAVRDHAYMMLNHKIRKGQPRKLFFGVITDCAKVSFTVKEKKVVHTGNYYPPCMSGGGIEYDSELIPGGLTDRKSHVLLWVSCEGGLSTDPNINMVYSRKELEDVRYNEKYTQGLGYGFYLLAEDCIHLREAKIAERLSGQPLRWGATRRQEKDSA